MVPITASTDVQYIGIPPKEIASAANWRPVDLGSEGDENNLTGRLQLRWLVTDALTVDLSLDGSRKRGHQGANHIDRIAPNAGILPMPRLVARLDRQS